MGIPVKLQVFEGPLDLLLHLIDKNKIDIYDIPIVEITSQYMDYIRAMEEEDLNIMSEFLLMAATLLDIKCRMLLPKEVNEDGEEEDPRQELVEQLLQYKMYKYMSYELKDRQLDGERYLYRGPDIPDEVADYVEPVNLDELLGDLTLGKLHSIFKGAAASALVLRAARCPWPAGCPSGASTTSSPSPWKSSMSPRSISLRTEPR